MIVDITVGLQAAGSRTRICTLVAYAGTIGRTVRVANALGTATLIGVANILLNTLADITLTTQATLGVAATW